MATWKDFYGSNYISSKTLKGGKIKGKILAVNPETMTGTSGKEATRLCCTLQGQDKLLPLNATNAEAMAKKYGDNYDKWKGRTVEVSTTKRTFAGNEVDGLLVRPL
jgi:hypothetical protein